ncbi:MAG TPA: endonuclease/exonuclease/phosphatase family protein [Patescibacteria group bacterium]|nr:endonuclease/exonuclease/phosphatase family protein [Patescibacteria group bacterium]
MLTVLSYNILFGNRIEEVIGWLVSSQKKYDILCFQEFPRAKMPLVQKMLNPYVVSYASNVIYQGKDYGQLTVLQNKDSQLIEAVELQLGTNFFEDKVLRLRGQRSSLITKVRYGKKTILLANTHLIAYASNKLRRKQLSMVLEHIERISQETKPSPTILLGDFNYSSLLRRQKLFSLIKKYGYTNAHRENTHRLLFVKHHQLDYIFYRNCNVSDVTLLKESFSDHLPMAFHLHL